jgi:uroporphyrinogen decarboxylase
MNIAESRAIIGPEKTLQGNLDPCVLYADDTVIRRETEKMLQSFANGRHIANLGHGVYPDTNPEKVKVFIETVKAYQIR